MKDSFRQELAELVHEEVSRLDDAERFALRKRRRRGRVSGFRQRLRRYWGDSLDALEELVATCAELGDKVAQAHQRDTHLFAALELLRSRAVQVAWEVHALVSAGYADGAYARWRTLHEIAVVSEFLGKFGEDAAQRYLDHAQIKNRKVIREYNECQERLGYPPIPQLEIDRSEGLRAKLLEQYGKDFGNEWGWASQDCGKADPSFFDIRAAADYGHWKAHFGMANHAVHGGPHGILFRLGHPLGSKPMSLSGPSLVGLGDPIDASSISLMHATFAFVSAIRSPKSIDLELELSITAEIKLVSLVCSRIASTALDASRVIDRKFGRPTQL